MESRNHIPVYPRHPLTRDPAEAPQAQKMGPLRKPRKGARNAYALRFQTFINRPFARESIEWTGVDQVPGRLEYRENRSSLVGRKDFAVVAIDECFHLNLDLRCRWVRNLADSKAEEKRRTIVRYASTEATGGH